MSNNTTNLFNEQFKEQVINLANETKGCKIFTMSYKSEVKLTKAQTALIGGKVTKITTGQFQFNFSYENAVNNRASKQTGEQPDFISGKLPWNGSKWYSVNKIIEYNGAYYLRFYQMKGGKVVTGYFVNDMPATDEQNAILFDIAKAANAKQTHTQTEVGLTDNQVKPRNIKIDNIYFINLNGKIISQFEPKKAM